jgi:hypothetical protein
MTSTLERLTQVSFKIMVVKISAFISQVSPKPTQTKELELGSLPSAVTEVRGMLIESCTKSSCPVAPISKMYSVAPELDCVPPSIFTFLINSLLLD